LPDQASGMAASGQRRQGPASPSMALVVVAQATPSNPASVLAPPELVRIADAWPALLPHIREAILTLADAGLDVDRASSADEPSSETTTTSLTRYDFDEVARRVAKECRYIVQACLREEEWQDAEEEFVELIADGIAELSIRSKPSDASC